MDITTQTTTLVTIQLTEQEARIALAEPETLQRQLRAALQPVAAARSNGRKSLHLGKATSRPKVPVNGRSAASGKVPCPHCGKYLKPRGMKLHLRKAHPDAASAATG